MGRGKKGYLKEERKKNNNARYKYKGDGKSYGKEKDKGRVFERGKN